MKFFDTFAGIGGFHEGIIRANPEAECVGFSEVNKYAISVYEKNYPGIKNYGDIRTINTGELPAFDLLVGGFPCQPFSITGNHLGFQDTRGTLFFELARILKDCQPSYFCFENVKNLISHDAGNTFRVIVQTLTELGYDLQWQVINSASYVPQNRERIYIIGHLGQRPRPEVFPARENARADITLPALTTKYKRAEGNGGYIGYEQKTNRS